MLLVWLGSGQNKSYARDFSKPLSDFSVQIVVSSFALIRISYTKIPVPYRKLEKNGKTQESVPFIIDSIGLLPNNSNSFEHNIFFQ